MEAEQEGLKLETYNPTKRALKKEEILSIIEIDLPESLNFSRDLFVFSYLARGMNFKDIALLRHDKNIINNRIVYLRSKTLNSNKAIPISIPIGQHLSKILSSYTSSEKYIFPIVFNSNITPSNKQYCIQSARKKVNKDLKEIARLAGIVDPIGVTFYCARHTYATVLKQSGESVEMISELLGHKDIKTTQLYLGKFYDSAKDATDEHLL